MKFEEVLPLMRQGKKARHAKMKGGEYWACGTAKIALDDSIPPWKTMFRGFHNPFQKDNDIYSWGIERWAIIEDTWEIVEEEDS